MIIFNGLLGKQVVTKIHTLRGHTVDVVKDTTAHGGGRYSNETVLIECYDAMYEHEGHTYFRFQEHHVLGILEDEELVAE